MRQIAYFDLDGSLADFYGTMSRSLQLLASPEETISYEELHKLEKLPHIHERMTVIKAQPGWWLNLDRIEPGFEVLKRARNFGYEVHILSRGPDNCSSGWKEKVEWCKNQPELENVPIHVVSDKSIAIGELLYDDHPKYALNWLEFNPNGLIIMPETNYNVDFKHPNIVKHNESSIEDVTDALAEQILRFFSR